MANLLTQNAKMKASSTGGYVVYNWTLPAVVTCPSRGTCETGCYATQGAYVWPVVRAAHQRNLDLTKTSEFVQTMITEVTRRFLRVTGDRTLVVRIHDAGDFYSLAYTRKWLKIVDAFKDVERIRFYAYTKQVKLWQVLAVPINLTLIYSEGGLHDRLVDTSCERHSRVFSSREELLEAGYADSSEDDLVAALGTNHRVGLVYHGHKSRTWVTNQPTQSV